MLARLLPLHTPDQPLDFATEGGSDEAESPGVHMDQFRVYVWDIECIFEGRYGPDESEIIRVDGIYDLRDDTVIINLVGFDFYDLTLSQPLVEDCVADEVRYSGIVIFFHPLAYDFFFLGRETEVMKVFAVLAGVFAAAVKNAQTV